MCYDKVDYNVFMRRVIMDLLRDLEREEKGQGLVEYGLILALVSVVAVGAIGGVGDKVTNTFNTVKDAEIVAKIEDGYVPVATAEDLQAIDNGEVRVWGEGTKWAQDSKGHSKFIQVQDIDLKGISRFKPIGDGSIIDDSKDANGEILDTTLSNRRVFSGTFDGGGYKIHNLTVDTGSESYAGMFGYAEGATFNNISLVDSDIKGFSFVGGLVGRNNHSMVTNCSVTGNVLGKGMSTGGLVGRQHNTVIKDSYSGVNVTGGEYHAGGLVGWQQEQSKIINSHTSGITKGTNEVGGLVGVQVNNSTIIDSYASGDVKGSASVIGGLAGHHGKSSIISNSYSTGDVSGISSIGGLVGLSYHKSLITNSYTLSKVSGVARVGAFLGASNKSLITDSMWGIDVNGGLDGIGFVENEGEYNNIKGLLRSEVEAIIRGLRGEIGDE